MSDKSATERLRALLDERGVEWMPSVFDPQHETFYSVENGVGFIVTEFPEIQRMSLACDMRITPEQAIAATLGDSDATGARRSDAVEVVRCRDCERFAVDQSDHEYRSGWWCKRWYTDMVKPDGFCAWGVRRESE